MSLNVKGKLHVRLTVSVAFNCLPLVDLLSDASYQGIDSYFFRSGTFRFCEVYFLRANMRMAVRTCDTKYPKFLGDPYFRG